MTGMGKAVADTIDNAGRTEGPLDLYQKYRPLTWEGIVGEDATVRALRTTVIRVRGLDGSGDAAALAPAYLFAGRHGCGKTTAAFIFARALNCPHVRQDGNPCNDCDVCRSIVMDSSINGFSYQPASNAVNIETVRSIIRDAYASSSLAHPVWILDEFQALQKSNGAYDEFLQPIENGDMPTTFIFCATDTKGIKPALISRCQQLNFAPVNRMDLTALCKSVMAAEGVRAVPDDDRQAGGRDVITESQIANAVAGGGGSVRDTLSRLSVVRLSGSGNGMAPSDRLLRSVFARQSISETVGVVEDVISAGDDAAGIMKTLMTDCGSMAKLADGGSTSALYSDQVKAMSKRYPATLFVQAMSLLGGALQDATWGAGDPGGYMELALLKIVILCQRQEAGKRR